LTQTNIIPKADLVITHGSNNTSTEAFNFGRPRSFCRCSGTSTTMPSACRKRDASCGSMLIISKTSSSRGGSNVYWGMLSCAGGWPIRVHIRQTDGKSLAADLTSAWAPRPEPPASKAATDRSRARTRARDVARSTTESAHFLSLLSAIFLLASIGGSWRQEKWVEKTLIRSRFAR
jgi:hypothetical protein